MFISGLTESLRKSYSARRGYSKWIHRFWSSSIISYTRKEQSCYGWKQLSNENRRKIQIIPDESQRTQSGSLPLPLRLYPSVHSNWRCPLGPAGMAFDHCWTVKWKHLPCPAKTLWSATRKNNWLGKKMLSCASYLKLHHQLQKVTQCFYMVQVVRFHNVINKLARISTAKIRVKIRWK